MSFGLQYNPTEENRFTHSVTNSYISQTKITAHSFCQYKCTQKRWFLCTFVDMDLGTLNRQQREAVTSTEGRVRVVAGAGSGKTKALTYRYAYIVNELGVEPANILCLTFTNKAAQEMRSRITQLVPPGYTNDFVCTIHGFCVRFLREEIHRLGYPKNFQILDEEDMKSLARQVLTENNTERSVKTVRQLLEALAGTKAAEPYVQQYIVPTSPVSRKD